MSHSPSENITLVLDIKAESGETPVWAVDEGKLYWVDQQKPTLNRFDPASGHNDSWLMPSHISSFALRGRGKAILVALRSGLHDFHPETGELVLRAAPPYDVSRMRFNDGRCDRQGRYIIGSVDLSSDRSQPGKAGLYRFDDTGLTQILSGVRVANGLAFSPDGSTMYRAETATREIFAYDYDTRAGTLSNERVFATLDRNDGIPDGAEVDSEGGYWVTLLMGRLLVRYRPDGTVDRRIALPVLQPTKPCFGGADLQTLYITTASHRHLTGDAPMGEAAGGIFAVATGLRGIPEPLLAID